MATNPYLVSLALTQPTAQVPTGTLVLVANEGDSVGPLTIEIPGVTNGIESFNGSTSNPKEYVYTKTGVAPGTYTPTIHDASPAHLPDFVAPDFTINPPPPPVPGCTDPDADNYDPNATQDNGSCAFTPRLTTGPLPELAPIGVPLVVVLTGQAVTGAMPAPATVVLDLDALGGAVGVQLRVDGYLFTSGPLIVPGRFVDADSLRDAMQAQPALAAAYAFDRGTGETVLLTSQVPGLPGTPTVSVSAGGFITVTPTAGVAKLWSQRRYNWGCYLEVWAGCGTEFGGVVDKSTAALAQRLELDYRADNAYAFDIAAALGKFTGHAYPLADGSCPDRLVSYFVRFGEQYSRAPTGPRLARNAYESAVAWAIEAMEVPAPVGGRYLLSARPGPWLVKAGAKAPFWQLGTPDVAARTLLRYRLATSRLLTDVVLGHQVATGQVTQAGDKLLAPPGALSGELRITDSTSAPGALLATLIFGASGQALTFVNRQGGFDTVYVDGSADPGSKRTASTFTNSAGTQPLSAEVALPTRLVSRLLDYATWDWLRRELGSSPAAWLETTAGPLAVRLIDVAADGDPIKGEYSVTVDYETAPVRGLSN